MKALFLVFLILIMLNAETAKATNLRGRLVGFNGSQYYPINGARVDILFWNGQTWVPASYAITGMDGFYYFVNVPPGYTFCLLIAGRYYPQQPLIVQSISPPYYQDIPLIVN